MGFLTQLCGCVSVPAASTPTHQHHQQHKQSSKQQLLKQHDSEHSGHHKSNDSPTQKHELPASSSPDVPSGGKQLPSTMYNLPPTTTLLPRMLSATESDNSDGNEQHNALATPRPPSSGVMSPLRVADSQTQNPYIRSTRLMSMESANSTNTSPHRHDHNTHESTRNTSRGSHTSYERVHDGLASSPTYSHSSALVDFTSPLTSSTASSNPRGHRRQRSGTADDADERHNAFAQQMHGRSHELYEDAAAAPLVTTPPQSISSGNVTPTVPVYGTSIFTSTPTTPQQVLAPVEEESATSITPRNSGNSQQPQHLTPNQHSEKVALIEAVKPHSSKTRRAKTATSDRKKTKKPSQSNGVDRAGSYDLPSRPICLRVDSSSDEDDNDEKYAPVALIDSSDEEQPFRQQKPSSISQRRSGGIYLTSPQRLPDSRPPSSSNAQRLTDSQPSLPIQAADLKAKRRGSYAGFAGAETLVGMSPAEIRQVLAQMKLEHEAEQQQ